MENHPSPGMSMQHKCSLPYDGVIVQVFQVFLMESMSMQHVGAVDLADMFLARNMYPKCSSSTYFKTLGVGSAL